MSKIIRNGNEVKSLHFSRIVDEPDPSLALPQEALSDQPEERLLMNAAEKARLIVEEAQSVAQQIKQDAYQQGYQEGLDLANSEMAKTVDAILTVAGQAVEEKWNIIKTVEDEIVNLALEIAEKVIAEQVKLEPGIVTNIAKKALMVAAIHEHIQIRVNPEDLEVMRASKDNLMVTMDGIEKIEVIADRRVRQGGCILETNAGNVDARIQSQLSEIQQSIKGVVSVD